MHNIEIKNEEKKLNLFKVEQNASEEFLSSKSYGKGFKNRIKEEARTINKLIFSVLFQLYDDEVLYDPLQIRKDDENNDGSPILVK